MDIEPDLTNFGEYSTEPEMDAIVSAVLLQEFTGAAPGDAITHPGE